MLPLLSCSPILLQILYCVIFNGSTWWDHNVSDGQIVACIGQADFSHFPGQSGVWSKLVFAKFNPRLDGDKQPDQKAMCWLCLAPPNFCVVTPWWSGTPQIIPGNYKQPDHKTMCWLCLAPVAQPKLLCCHTLLGRANQTMQGNYNLPDQKTMCCVNVNIQSWHFGNQWNISDFSHFFTKPLHIIVKSNMKVIVEYYYWIK